MSKTPEELLSTGDVFLKLSEEVDRELISTGFNPSKEPPGAEPVLPPTLSTKGGAEVKHLYDTFLVFYSYLSDRIAQTTVYLGVTKERVELIEAQVILEANARKDEYSNAELRKAYVKSHPALVSAQKDYVFFRQTVEAQNTRLKKISKSMDRLYRELVLRQPQYGGHGNGGGGYSTQERPRRKHGFKSVRTQST